jgi:hypothetical protein
MFIFRKLPIVFAHNGLALGDFAAERTAFYRQDRIFFRDENVPARQQKAMLA